MLSFTAVAICCKWIVIGRYRERNVSVPSIYHLRWWLVDRLVHAWETWVGIFLLETPILWLVYFFLVAKIHPTAQVEAFIREFDLVRVESHTSIGHSVVCGRFRSWPENADLLLTFRSIEFGSDCSVDGLVGLGSKIGDNCVVEKLSTVAEGSQVPESMQVLGNPAYGTSREDEKSISTNNSELCLIAALKIAWIFLELYFFSASLLFCQWVLNGRLPANFRYTPILFWYLAILLQTAVSMACTIALKWSLIRRVQPGESKPTVMDDMRAWVVDYRHRVTMHIVTTIGSNSKIMDLYLKALGVDINLASHVFAHTFCPSEADLVSVKSSFLSVATMEPTQKGVRQRIEVTNSSLGYGAVLKGGAVPDCVKAPPLSVLGGQRKGSENTSLEFSAWSIIFTEFFYVLLLGFLFVSVIPAFEIVTMASLSNAAGVGFSVPCLSKH